MMQTPSKAYEQRVLQALLEAGEEGVRARDLELLDPAVDEIEPYYPRGREGMGIGEDPMSMAPEYRRRGPEAGSSEIVISRLRRHEGWWIQSHDHHGEHGFILRGRAILPVSPEDTTRVLHPTEADLEPDDPTERIRRFLLAAGGTGVWRDNVWHWQRPGERLDRNDVWDQHVAELAKAGYEIGAETSVSAGSKVGVKLVRIPLDLAVELGGVARDQSIRQRAAEGMTYRRLGEQTGLSHQRIAQIVEVDSMTSARLD